MRTLHIFGDSFSQPFKEDWVWTNQLGNKLQVTALSNNSHIGVSNDWIFSKIRDAILGNQEKPLVKNDVAVVVITSPYRYWFFKDKPQFSNYMISNWVEFIDDKSIIDAIKGYVNHIQRDDLDQLKTEFQVGWLKQMRNQVGFDLLLIPGFVNSHTHIADSIGKDLSIDADVDSKIHPMIGLKQKLLKGRRIARAMSHNYRRVFRQINHGSGLLSNVTTVNNKPYLLF